MKPSFKLSLALVLGALAGLPSVMSAQDMNSSPSTSAPASSDSTTTTSSSGTQATDSSAPAPKKPHNHGGNAKQMLGMLKEKLSLTDEQVPKIQAILEDNNKQMMTIRGDTTLSDDDKKTKVEALRKSTHDQIRALLTPEQQTTFDSMKLGEHAGHKKADN